MTYYLPVLLFGTSGFLFGWAKPVPVNMQTVIRNGGYNAAMQVSLAGIVYNLFLATLCSVILPSIYNVDTKDSFIVLLTISMLQINVVLAVLNLLPIPSFDGAHFVTYVALKFRVFKVAEFFAKAEPYGMIVIILILMTPLKMPLLIWPVSTLLNLLLS
jgi:Zn-dependent protease